jgi:hypothetical protein
MTMCIPYKVVTGASVLRQNCDVLQTITNLSDELNMVCVRVGIEVIWSHVLLGAAVQLQLLRDPLEFLSSKPSINYMHSLRT